jgi:hypothetical protein
MFKKYWLCLYYPKPQSGDEDKLKKNKPFAKIVRQYWSPSWSPDFKKDFNLETVVGPYSTYDAAARKRDILHKREGWAYG